MIRQHTNDYIAFSYYRSAVCKSDGTMFCLAIAETIVPILVLQERSISAKCSNSVRTLDDMYRPFVQIMISLLAPFIVINLFAV